MPTPSAVDRYLEPLLEGDRQACREYVRAQLESAHGDASQVFRTLLWPTMERIDTLYRNDRINAAAEHMATRINRSLADQLQTSLRSLPANGKCVLVTSADGEPEELGAQMTADLFEARGWKVHFLGGGVPNDEVLSLVGRLRPELLLIFGTQPAGIPQVRALVDLIRSVGPNPTMNIMVSGGVFNRADGLWKEVHADLFAKTAKEAIPMAEKAKPREPQIVIPGAPKKRRRRRRPPLLASAQAD